jgi:hypothetical protein
MQTYGVCKELLNDSSALTYGLIMVCQSQKTEARTLAQGSQYCHCHLGRLGSLEKFPGLIPVLVGLLHGRSRSHFEIIKKT